MLVETPMNIPSHPVGHTRWCCRCFPSTVLKWRGPRAAAWRWRWRCLEARGFHGRTKIEIWKVIYGNICTITILGRTCFLSIFFFSGVANVKMVSSGGFAWYITNNHGGRTDTHGVTIPVRIHWYSHITILGKLTISPLQGRHPYREVYRNSSKDRVWSFITLSVRFSFSIFLGFPRTPRDLELFG